MTKDELLELIESLQITAQYFCDAGTERGSFRVYVYHPYVRTEVYDQLQQDLREYRGRKNSA